MAKIDQSQKSSTNILKIGKNLEEKFQAGDGFPEIDINLRDIASYAVLAVEMGGSAVKKIHEESGRKIKLC